MLANASVDHIHLFHSRTSAFNDDEVLQENVIIKLVRGKKQGKVRITTASDTTLSDLQAHDYPFAEIVHDADQQKFIHVPTAPSHSGQNGVPLAERLLEEIGLEVSTGPVVDFRLKEFLRDKPGDGTVPLLYPAHFVHGQLEWPRQSKKPNAMIDSPETRKWLYPKGFYTVVRRFSSKEERRRIVAHVVDPAAFKANAIGFENHLNVFHSGKGGIDGDVAHGLAVFLNSTAVDDYFRRFSGHTDRKSTRLNSSHLVISYAVFCLKKKRTAGGPQSQAPGTFPPAPCARGGCPGLGNVYRCDFFLISRAGRRSQADPSSRAST